MPGLANKIIVIIVHNLEGVRRIPLIFQRKRFSLFSFALLEIQYPDSCLFIRFENELVNKANLFLTIYFQSFYHGL